MTWYVNWKGGQGLETVDEFETYKEARAMLWEYRGCGFDNAYLSRRACKGWRESSGKEE